MESGHKNLQPKISSKLDQEKPPKKKGLWQKIKDFFTQGSDSQYWEDRDPSDW